MVTFRRPNYPFLGGNKVVARLQAEEVIPPIDENKGAFRWAATLFNLRDAEIKSQRHEVDALKQH